MTSENLKDLCVEEQVNTQFQKIRNTQIQVVMRLMIEWILQAAWTSLTGEGMRRRLLLLYFYK